MNDLLRKLQSCDGRFVEELLLATLAIGTFTIMVLSIAQM